MGQTLVPLVGVVDTAVVGRTRDATALAGVALGASVINLIFWTFGFLRMGVTGITAQAKGAADEAQIKATLVRAVVLGGALGVVVLLFAPLIIPWALRAIAAPDNVIAPARAFIAARLFGAPGALAFYAINGWLIGLGRTRIALMVQLIMNGVNIGVDVLLVNGFGMGALGVGIGTAVAEWSALVCGLFACRRVLGPQWRAELAAIGRRNLLSPTAMKRLVAVNTDIMIRTVAILVLFTWFARAGARLGAVPLAGNHVLMQFVSISAFVLDGFAFTAEARVGAAVGAGSLAGFKRAIRLTGEFSLISAAMFSLLIWSTGAAFIEFVTQDPATRAAAGAMLGLCALVPMLGAPSWLLDGIFIGATRGRMLRNAAIVATLAYLVTDHLLEGWGNTGVWTALLASYIYRALSLGAYLPSLAREIKARPAPGEYS